MAQKDRSKELWLIPKRVNLHQSICLIDGIIERKYNGTVWGSQKQDNLGVNLKKWGATKNGKNISPQSIRTLVASIPQYLGFIYIDTKTTPSVIRLTDAGIRLWEMHKDDLIKVKNLQEGEHLLIKESTVVLEQMEKLQLTNPIYVKDCNNILLFPFRMTLKLMMELEYLDREELAYFVFKMRSETEYALTIAEIKNFRKLDVLDRLNLINEFKKTHIGQITLVKAASAGYYETLCLITGIVAKCRVKPVNVESEITALKIKEECLPYASKILQCKYADALPYDFKDDLDLWIQYIGNPKRLLPPVDVTIKNVSEQALLMQIKKDGEILDGNLIAAGEAYLYPMFYDEEYGIDLISIDNGKIISSEKLIPKIGETYYEIFTIYDAIKMEDTIQSLSAKILSHVNCRNFCGNMLNYLTIINKITQTDKTQDKSLRGAYLELLFYKLLVILKENNVIDEVIWNGKIGQYGLPLQAPGGVTGTPDIVFMIDNTHYVLELTTIKAKAMQFSAEGASVPDHIRLYKEKNNCDVIGIFSAPQIHERNINSMKSITNKYGIHLNCVRTQELTEILLSMKKESIIGFLEANES